MHTFPLQARGLTNPVFGIPGVSVRDPAAIWHNGLCYLYYTRQEGPWAPAGSWSIAMVTTTDFREFSPETVITPHGYASPGNVVRCGDRWVMPIQSYPWPSEIALVVSEDLVAWSTPRHIVPVDTGPGWGEEHGPIDGWLLEYGGEWRCLWVNFLRGTEHRSFGAHASIDLVNWENLTPNRPLIDGSAYDHNGGVENCSIVSDGEQWHFFASVGMDPQSLAHVASKCPTQWPALTPADEIPLPRDEWCVYHQSAVFVDDWREQCGRWAMIYHGAQTRDGRASFGLAFSDDLWAWDALPG